MASGPTLLDPLRAKLAEPGRLRLVEPPEGALALVICELASDAGPAGCLYIARSEARAERLARAVPGFAPDLQVIVLPAWDCLPYDRFSPSPSVMARRLAALSDMARPAPSAGRLVLTTVECLLQRVPPASIHENARLRIAVGEPLIIEELKVDLIRAGYVLDERVDEPGEAALRGTIDVFPGADEQPFRVRLDDSRVTVIDRYDPVTQRTESSADQAIMYPVSEVVLDESQVRRFLQDEEGQAGEETGQSGDGWTHRLLSGAKDEPRRIAALEHWLPLFHQPLSTVFDLLPEARVVLDSEVGERRDAWFEQIADAHRHRLAMAAASGPGHAGHLPPLPPDRLYLDAAEWSRNLRGRLVVELGDAVAERSESNAERSERIERPRASFEAPGEPVVELGRPGVQPAEPNVQRGESIGRPGEPGRGLDDGEEAALDVRAIAVPRFSEADQPARALANYIAARRKAGDRVVLAGPTAAERRRFTSIVERRFGDDPEGLAGWADVATLKPGAVAVLPLDIAEGFAVEGWAMIAAADAVPASARPAASPGRAAAEVFAGDGLRIGDLVVQPEHGIGQVLGLELLDQNGAAHECLSLAYAANQKLLVPAEEIGGLWRYGSSDAGISLDRLSGDGWAARKAEVDAEVEETARALVKLAKEREGASAPRLPAPSGRYRRFAAHFPYSETPDQLRAIEAVLRDLASGRPMNRLVCGDVGFGKTEVALRAAAVAVFSGKQVALVAPTTVLVRQHLETFRRRFAEFGVRVEALSRASRAAANRAIGKGLADGSIGIVIGTQAIASDKLRFHDLGLVIIDEEQRFGQRQKEQLREIQSGTHVLAMTATPIPRTLQSALAGVIDLSVIATPPVRRRPVRTFVLAFDRLVVRDALLREQMQGGQSFVVCPRIADLEPMRERLAELVPELDIAVAHGRMKADALDETMVAFADGAHDVLLTTNIIEAGLDIPSANTMLVWHPDRFGLADLHQLRGRVGRGRRRGMVYLLTDAEKPLPQATEKRVRTLQALEGLGAGFAIGARDLDMRGAGDLLGETQSGHVRLIGAELYQHLLERAVRRVRGEPADDDIVPDIRIGLGVAIPRDYVPEDEIRIDLYRRLARLNSEWEASDLANEIADRFGPLPDQVRDLVDFCAIRSRCAAAGLAKVEAGPNGIAVTFANEDARVAAEKAALDDLDAARWSGERLVLQVATEQPRQRIEAIRKVLGVIQEA